LSVRHGEPQAAEQTVVERAWIQTRFGPDGRFDRAVFALTSREKRLTVRLPQGINVLSALFRLDELPVTESGGSLGDRKIPLVKPGRHVLEITYSMSLDHARRGVQTIEFPQLDPAVEVRETYWQLVLPRDEHLLGIPKEMENESTWSSHGFYWGRSPNLDQADLARWSGLKRKLTPLPAAGNIYLFSATRAQETVAVQVVGRTTLVMAASGLALAVGLVFVYMPLVRHPAVILVVSIGVLASAALDPDMALLGLQAAALGLMLTVLAVWLKRQTSLSHPRPAVRSASSSIVGRGSSRSHPRVTALGAPMSTQTAAVAVEMSAPEVSP
jgi:hypothetical protein